MPARPLPWPPRWRVPAAARAAAAANWALSLRTSDAASGYHGEYSGERLSRVAFPLGGMGAGMICLEGTGAFSHFSLRHRPEVYHEPCTFAAISVEQPRKVARVLEGPVPGWKLFGQPGTGNGAGGASFGLPRFREAHCRVRFPFSTVAIHDKEVPLEVQITGGARSNWATPTTRAFPWPPWNTDSTTSRTRP